MIKMIVFKLNQLLKKKGYAREDGEVKYREAARDIGISHSALWKLANQDKLDQTYNPSVSTIDSLCRFFHCQPGDILTYKKE